VEPHGPLKRDTDLEPEAVEHNEQAEAAAAKVEDMLANAGRTQDVADDALDEGTTADNG
jgi:hypothetical protein